MVDFLLAVVFLPCNPHVVIIIFVCAMTQLSAKNMCPNDHKNATFVDRAVHK